MFYSNKEEKWRTAKGIIVEIGYPVALALVSLVLTAILWRWKGGSV